MSLLKSAGSSTLDIVGRIREIMPHLLATLPPEYKMDLIFDQSLYVRAAVECVIKEGAIAAGLTALMILLFSGKLAKHPHVVVPVVFIAGSARSLFTPLSMSVVFAMMMSYFLSRTLVPTMVHHLLRAEVDLYAPEAGGKPTKRDFIFRISRKVQRPFRAAATRVRRLPRLGPRPPRGGRGSVWRLRRRVAPRHLSEPGAGFLPPSGRGTDPLSPPTSSIRALERFGPRWIFRTRTTGSLPACMRKFVSM